MKRRIFTIATISALILSVPIGILSAGFLTPQVFGETYYGELGYQYHRLKEAKKKKIVFVGNSTWRRRR